MTTKIMAVDDSELLHSMYDLVLRKYRSQGGAIFHAMNGKEGLDKLEELDGDIQLIILDINMPVMNGLEMLELVKRHDKYKSIPVLIVTTEGKEEDVKRGLRLGAEGYLTKPFKSDSILQLIERLLKMQG